MLEKIKDFVSEQLEIDREEIKPDTDFRNDLGADSLDLFELVMNLEEEYGIQIPAEDLEKIETVADVIRYLKDHGIEEAGGTEEA